MFDFSPSALSLDGNTLLLESTRLSHLIFVLSIRQFTSRSAGLAQIS